MEPDLRAARGSRADRRPGPNSLSRRGRPARPVARAVADLTRVRSGAPPSGRDSCPVAGAPQLEAIAAGKRSGERGGAGAPAPLRRPARCGRSGPPGAGRARNLAASGEPNWKWRVVDCRIQLATGAAEGIAHVGDSGARRSSRNLARGRSLGTAGL